LGDIFIWRFLNPSDPKPSKERDNKKEDLTAEVLLEFTCRAKMTIVK